MLKRIKNKKIEFKNAQVIVEYTFCMIIVFLMIFSAIKVFRWSGLDLAERRVAHDAKLISGAACRTWNALDPTDCLVYATVQATQLDDYFAKPTDMGTIWDGD